MIGLQEIVIKQNIKVRELARDIECCPSNIYDWFRNNKISKTYLKILTEKLNVDEEYLNKQVNAINTYKPKTKGFQNQYKVDGEVTYIYITNRKNETYEILIDTEDLDKLIEFDASWFLSWSKSSKKNYISAMKYDGINEKGKKKYRTYYLERFVTNAPPKTHVDHEDQNPLNNRKYNLRVTSVANNIKHRKSKNSNNKSGYRNVCWIKNKWIVQLQIDGKNTKLGSFDNVDEAGKFAEKMRQKYYGEFKGKN